MKNVILVALSTMILSHVSIAAMTIEGPKRSQSTGERGNAELLDESLRRNQILGVYIPDANGHTGLNSHFVPGKRSPVTGKEEPGCYMLADGLTCVPIVTLASINQSTHSVVPFALGGFGVPQIAQSITYTANQQAIVPVADKPSGGSVGSAATTVDVAGVLNVNQTTAGQTLTLPNPTATAQAHTAYIMNVGTAPFTILGQVVPTNTPSTKGAEWNGSAWFAF